MKPEINLNARQNNPESHQEGVQKLYAESELYRMVLALIADGKPYTEIAGRLGAGVTIGDVGRAKDGIFPKSRRKRNQMRLLPFEKKEVCPIHGVVHTHDCRTERVVKKPTPAEAKPRKRALRKRVETELTPSENERLEALCKKSKITKAEFLRRLIQKEL